MPIQSEASNYIRNLVKSQRLYILDHKYDPSEIYADEFKEELGNFVKAYRNFFIIFLFIFQKIFLIQRKSL